MEEPGPEPHRCDSSASESLLFDCFDEGLRIQLIRHPFLIINYNLFEALKRNLELLKLKI